MMLKQVRLGIAGARTPLVERTAAILGRRIAERSAASVLQAPASGPADIVLAVAGAGPAGGFRIESARGRAVRVVGNDGSGLLHGAGKLLRTARYGDGSFAPGAWRGAEAPLLPVRCVYLCTHFFNTYHVGPVDQTVKLIEDLGLWGCNVLAVWFDMHHFRGMDDPAAGAMVERLRAFLQAAQAAGMGAALMLIANEGYSNSPAELRGGAHGAYGVELCPSKPGGLELMLKWRREMFEAFADLGLRYVVIWPYDQGGCDCPACSPWGANGFLRAARPVAEMAREFWPAAQRALSTWWFDTHYSGEWEGLAAAFRQRPDWIEYLMADSQEDSFPAYPFVRGVPGGLPMLCFPEISMHGMYPWGGFGANPLPSRLQRRWQEIGRHVAGGFMYSEGIYEDINKAIVLQQFWSDRPATETVREYAAFEFGDDVADDIADAVQLMERGHVRRWRPAPGESEPVARLLDTTRAAECHATLKRAARRMTAQARDGWRWKVLHLRGVLDAELAASGGRPTNRIKACLNDLSAIYHMSPTARHCPARRTVQESVTGPAHPPQEAGAGA